MTHFLVAVDGGGTGTRVRAYSPERTIIGLGEAGPSSLTLGAEQAWENIFSAIRQATKETPISGRLSIRIVAGLAGSRNRKQCQTFISHVNKQTGRGITIDVVSDAYTSALGALGGQPGIVIAIGTGMGACAINESFQPHYTSGWGFKVGDEGAGSWIGLQAVQAYLKHIDGRAPRESRLHQLLAETIGETVMAIQAWCLQASPTDFAALAKPIVALANERDELALAILRAAGTEVAQTIQALETDNVALPIVLIGGLGQSMQPYLPEAYEHRLMPAKGSALDGAAMILFGDCPTEPS